MNYTKQQLLGMYLKYCKEKYKTAEVLRKKYVVKRMREKDETLTLISMRAGRQFIDSLED